MSVSPEQTLIPILGQGIIMLLAGEPGVGKTLTAESGTFHNIVHSKNPALG